MALYKDGNPVSGLNSIPRLTLAQYNALNVKPEFWVRTDAPESYKKLSADQVSYDSNNTVEDMIASITSSIIAQQYHTAEFGTFYQTVKASGTTYQSVPITGIKLTMANGRYTILGMVLQGSSLGNRFVAYSSWGNASVVITGESI